MALIVAIRDRKLAYTTGRAKDGAPAVAVNTFDHLRAIFVWAMRPERRKSFGLRFDPIAHLRIKDFGIKRKVRQTVLSPEEIRAYWLAAGKMGYPWGSLFRLLMTTGQRLNEIACASWPEFDLAEKLLVIPPERFKSNATHPIPLSDLAMEIVSDLPRGPAGPFVFSVKQGRTPATAMGAKKKELDALMLVELRKIARERGEPEPENVRHFVLHDLRRVVRSNLSALRVPDVVAELTIGHGKKGLARVYDQHAYLPEMRDALQAWADRLRTIVNPPSGTNVVLMRKAVG
ncbi:site-specific integrase [Aquibium pacificus]|uniref:site-specific integrase n=1 Tax=Aquibium pacificus TaxID=3153579 RepID=UPI00349F993A